MPQPTSLLWELVPLCMSLRQRAEHLHRGTSSKGRRSGHRTSTAAPDQQTAHKQLSLTPPAAALPCPAFLALPCRHLRLSCHFHNPCAA